MTKFYVLRTSLAEITEVTEIEADSKDMALEAVNEGEGRFLGVSIGDYHAGIEDNEVLDAAPHNIPAYFYPAEAAR
jgi:hypothetical protein